MPEIGDQVAGRRTPLEEAGSIRIVQVGRGFDRWSEVLALLRQSFAYMEARIDPPSSMNRLDLEGLKAKSGVETCLLAMRAERIAGCAFLDAKQDCLYVGKVAVAEKMRGLGIARLLLEEAENRAAGLRLPFLELQSRVELVENHRTFQRLGFSKCGEDAHPGYDRPTSITMRKPVEISKIRP